MTTSYIKNLRTMRWIRREFWIGNTDWYSSLDKLRTDFNMRHEDAVNFLGDSTNLDAAAKLQANLVAFPFGVSLIHPSILL